MQKTPFLRSKKHLNFIKTGRCLICYKTPCDPAHLGFGIGGMALKSDDCFVVPLCREHHTIQHNIGERPFWKKHHINPFLYAIQYCAMSPCEKIKENYKDCFQEKYKNSLLLTKNNILI